MWTDKFWTDKSYTGLYLPAFRYFKDLSKFVICFVLMQGESQIAESRRS